MRFKWSLVAGILVLTLSWGALGWIVDLMLVESLTPYSDRWPETRLPPRGTWRRELNDFFERNEGLLPGLAVGGSMALFAVALARLPRGKIPLLALSFALSNLAIAASMFFGTFIVADLPLRSILPPEYPPGYDRALRFIVFEVLCLNLLFILQGWNIPQFVTSGHE